MKVLTTGCFDVFHIGHANYLKNIAIRYPDAHRVVGIADDVAVRHIKGPKRPIYTETERRDILRSCKYVDAVYVFDVFLDEPPDREAGFKAFIIEQAPDVYVTGRRTPNQHARRFCKELHIPFVIIDALDFTTTKLIERITDVY